MNEAVIKKISELRNKGYSDTQILESLFTIISAPDYYQIILDCLKDLEEELSNLESF